MQAAFYNMYAHHLSLWLSILQAWLTVCLLSAASPLVLFSEEDDIGGQCLATFPALPELQGITPEVEGIRGLE